MDSQFTLLGEKIDAVYYLLKDRPPCNCGLIEPLIPWLSRQEVMDHLKISDSTYYEWRKKGILQPIQSHGEDRYTPCQINEVVLGLGYRKRLRPKK